MRALPAVLLCLALACGSPTEPDPTLQFEGRVVFGIATLPVTAQGLDGGIKVSGVIPTPTSDYTLTGHLSAVGGRKLILEVSVDSTRAGVPLPVQNYYESRIGNLNKGAYDLEVIHTLHIAATQTASVFRGVVQVP